tara:strand:+ start:118 stop:2418 length:2301 start_codon:yes stop_codon:yes gene_type:complete
MKRITLALMLTFGLGQAHALVSGLDDGGYYYKDSDESGFSYDFDDISSDTNRILISLSDDSSRSIPVGFNFSFYDVVYSTLNVSSNGYISFTSGSNGCCSGKVIPSADSNSRMGAGIAAWWEDLNPRSGGSVEYLTKGTSPNRELIIQFTDVPAYSNSGRNTFQYKIKENDNSVEVHYKELYGDSGSYSIGVQKNSTIGLQYYYGQGGNAQNSVPAFSLPHAIKYEQKDVGYSESNSEIKTTLYPGQNKSLNLELINRKSQATDIEVETVAVTSGLSIVPAITNFNVGANSSFVLSYLVEVTPTALGTLNGTIRVSSSNGSFETFDVSITINISNIEQLSFGSTNNTTKPKISDDGKLLVVLSRDDLAGNGKLNSSTDLFLYDVENASYKQLTSNAAGRVCSNSAISGDGNFAAAVCNGNLDLSKPNNNATNEVYVFNLLEETLFQLGADLHANTGVDDLVMSKDGNVILFIANDNLTGENSDRSAEVFSYNLSSQEYTQLSWFNYSFDVANVDIDNNGERFVVSSKGNPFNENQINNLQVFSGEINKGVNRQITKFENRQSGLSKLSANGEFIVFTSNMDLTSPFSSRNQIYLTDFKGREFIQITKSQSYNSAYPDISADGSKVIFISEGSYDGANRASNYELFIYDARKEAIKQLTEVNDSRDVSALSITANGSRIAFSGLADWDTGENPARSEQLFLISGLEENSVRGFKEDVIKLPSYSSNLDEYEENNKRNIMAATGSVSWFFIGVLSLLAIRKRKVNMKV